MSKTTAAAVYNPTNRGNGGERKDKRKDMDKKSATSPVVPQGERSTGGKRICIQDADGKIFFLQCPAGFAGGDGEESAVPLAAWVSSTARKRAHPDGRDSSPPVATAAALVKMTKSTSSTPPPQSSASKGQELALTSTSSPSSQQLALDRKPIQYETGYDPLTGEVKGPDIDPSEILGAGFCRNESSAVRDVKSTEDLNKAWFTTAKDKEALIDKGINWKQGAWSQEEVAILNENIKEYCSTRGIEDPAHVIFNMSKEERSDFYPTIAKGLQRPLFAVYRRVKRDYDVNNHKGVYTQAEVDTLKSLLKQFGPDWKLIGEKLGRSAQSVKDRCRQFKDAQGGLVNNGKWSPDEEKRLIMAVHEVGRPTIHGGGGGGAGGSSTAAAGTGSLTDEASWVVSAGKWRTVASLVKTRTEKQCRLKWSEVVKASISVGAGDAIEPSSTTTPPVTSSSGAAATMARGGGGGGVVSEWGAEEDAQLLSTLNKVMNNSHHNHSGEFKTSRLEAADFVGAIGSSGGGGGGGGALPPHEFAARDAMLAAAVASSASAANHLSSSVPSAVSSSSSHHASAAAAAAAAAAAGLMTSAIHLPSSSAQQLHPHQVMPEGSYIWTHHAL